MTVRLRHSRIGRVFFTLALGFVETTSFSESFRGARPHVPTSCSSDGGRSEPRWAVIRIASPLERVCEPACQDDLGGSPCSGGPALRRAHDRAEHAARAGRSHSRPWSTAPVNRLRSVAVSRPSRRALGHVDDPLRTRSVGQSSSLLLPSSWGHGGLRSRRTGRLIGRRSRLLFLIQPSGASGPRRDSGPDPAGLPRADHSATSAPQVEERRSAMSNGSANRVTGAVPLLRRWRTALVGSAADASRRSRGPASR
jgi:hypothetical protein